MTPIDLSISFATDDVGATFRSCFDLGVIQRDPLGAVHELPTYCRTSVKGRRATLKDIFREVGQSYVAVADVGERRRPTACV